MRLAGLLRSAANDALRAVGLEMRRKPPILVRSPNELRMNLEYAMAHLAAFNPGQSFTVMQIGALDGVTGDPLERALATFGWSAILVEPQAEPFAELSSHYENDPSIQTFNVAISDRDGTGTLYILDPTDDLPSWTRGIASFDRDHLLSQQKQLPGIDVEGRIQALVVPTWTFGTLFETAGINRVDVLLIDTEGYDLELLKLFEVANRLPAIIQYEHQHLSRSDRDSAARLLVGAGYQLAMTFAAAGDTIAVR